MTDEIRQAFLTTFREVNDYQAEVKAATAGISNTPKQELSVTLTDLSYLGSTEKKRVTKWPKQNRLSSTSPYRNTQHMSTSRVQATPKVMMSAAPRSEPHIAVMRESELTEDYLFGQLVTKRIRAVPEGFAKEKLKCDILNMLFDCQYKAKAAVAASTNTTAAKTSVPVVTSTPATVPAAIAIPVETTTVTLSSAVDNSQSTLLDDLSKAMNV